MAEIPADIRRLINEEAEAVRPLEDAAAAEEIARARGGRPRLADEPTEQLVVRLPTSLRDALAKRAKEKHVTVSSATRDAIERYLAA